MTPYEKLALKVAIMAAIASIVSCVGNYILVAENLWNILKTHYGM